MVVELGEFMQGFATAHRSLLTTQDFVSTESGEKKLTAQYGAIPREIWVFARDHGDRGKALIRQWYSDNGELIEHILGADPRGERDRSAWESLYASATALVNSLVGCVERWSESVPTRRALDSEPVPG
jgi:hypothetical protein